MKKEIEYTVVGEEYVLSMQGDRAEDMTKFGDPEECGTYLTLQEAVARAEELAADPDSVKLHDQRRGIGSIEHRVYYVSAYVFDEEDGEWLPCDENGEQDEWGGADSLYYHDCLDDHPELKEAWQKAVKGYYAYLDYEADGYAGVRAYMDNEQEN